MNRLLLTVAAVLMISTAIASPSPKGPPPKPAEDDLVCEKTADITPIMEKNGFFHLLNMTNKNDVVETVWINATSVIVTAQSKDMSCVIAMMKDVVFNSNTIAGLNEAYMKQAKKQKDI